MYPHRPGYDPHADKLAAEQRDAAMRDTRIGPSDRRLPPMQPSGLPQRPMESAYDYASSQQHHPKPPLTSSTSHDHSGARAAPPHERHERRPAMPGFAPEHVQHAHPRSHSERAYEGGYDASNNDPRSRPQYYEERSPRHPVPPQYASQYGPSADGQHHQQHYQDHPSQRQHEPYAYQAHPHPDQHSYAHRDARIDERARGHVRPGLPSPRDYPRPAGRISPSNDMASREAAYLDHGRGGPGARPSPHDRRHMPELRHDAIGSSHPSAFSSSSRGSASPTVPRSTTASRKRKKQFKYMLEQDGADPSKAPNAGDVDDENDADRTDLFDTGDGTGSASQRKESRKKVKKACIFCKRSHMPCEEARPCKRCVKRGISHLCRDAEPVGSAGTAAASGSGSSSTKSKFEEARDQARARRRREEEARINNDNAPETESGSDAESMTSSLASSFRNRFGRGSETGSMSSSRSRGFDMNEMPGAAARDPDFRPTMPISVLLSPEKAELARRPRRREMSPGVSEQEQKEAWNRSMDLSTQYKMKQMLEAGPAAGDLSDIFGEIPTSLLMTPAMANLPKGQAILRPGSADPPGSPHRTGKNEREKRLKRSQSMTLTSSQCEVDEAGFKLPPRPKHLLQEEMATTSELRGGPPTYSYTYGYAKLARWMHTRFSRASCEEVDRSLSVIRPKLMALSRSLPEQELISVEDSFYQLLAIYQANVLETIPIPMIVARRTGEIYAANSHACKLMQLPESIFEGGQICHYQLVTEKDCVNMWGKYADEARGRLDLPPSQKVMLEVDRSLLLFNKPAFDPQTGELLGDGSGLCEDGSPAVLRRQVIVTFEAKISKHGLPFMVTGFIIPIPDDD